VGVIPPPPTSTSNLKPHQRSTQRGHHEPDQPQAQRQPPDAVARRVSECDGVHGRQFANDKARSEQEQHALRDQDPAHDTHACKLPARVLSINRAIQLLGRQPQTQKARDACCGSGLRSSLPDVGRLYLRQETFALGAFTGQFPGAADGFGLAASLGFRGLLEGGAGFHFPEDAFTLHLLLERFQRLIDVVIADHDLNYLKLSIGFPAGPGTGSRTQKTPKRPDPLLLGMRVARTTGDLTLTYTGSVTGRRRSDTI